MSIWTCEMRSYIHLVVWFFQKLWQLKLWQLWRLVSKGMAHGDPWRAVTCCNHQMQWISRFQEFAAAWPSQFFLLTMRLHFFSLNRFFHHCNSGFKCFGYLTFFWKIVWSYPELSMLQTSFFAKKVTTFNTFCPVLMGWLKPWSLIYAGKGGLQLFSETRWLKRENPPIIMEFDVLIYPFWESSRTVRRSKELMDF